VWSWSDVLPLREAVREFEREYIARALAEHGSVSAAARALRMNRTHLHRRIARLGIVTPRKARRGSWAIQGL